MERIGFDGNHLECPSAGNAVAVGVKTNRLVFIHLHIQGHTGIKAMSRQSHGGGG